MPSEDKNVGGSLVLDQFKNLMTCRENALYSDFLLAEMIPYYTCKVPLFM